MNRVYFSLLKTRYNSRKTAAMFRSRRHFSNSAFHGGGPNNNAYWFAVAVTIGVMSVLRRDPPKPIAH